MVVTSALMSVLLPLLMDTEVVHTIFCQFLKFYSSIFRWGHDCFNQNIYAQIVQYSLPVSSFCVLTIIISQQHA